MRRMLCLLLLLCLMPLSGLAETITLLTADTVDEVASLVLLPQNGQLPDVQRGAIRYISLNPKDPAYLASSWTSDRFDLTVKKGRNGETYRADMTNMHSRAVYCMALSYLGVDLTPAAMSELVNSRDITAPFDGVTAKLSVKLERVQPRAYVFDTMIENYLNDPTYSPVFMEVRKPNGALHTVLVVAYIPETGGFIIVDPAAPKLEGQHLHTYKMALHVMRQVVLHSAFYDAFYASKVISLYQWHLVEE